MLTKYEDKSVKSIKRVYCKKWRIILNFGGLERIGGSCYAKIKPESATYSIYCTISKKQGSCFKLKLIILEGPYS